MNREPKDIAQEPDDPTLRRNVLGLGWVAFFGGLAQDMIQPVLPLFYTSVLGLNKEFIGLIEGLFSTVTSLMKIAAGYLCDALGVRKKIVFVGYALSAVARFSFGFVATGAAAMGARLSDGMGKGIKDAPRDALVAGSAGLKRLGFAFGVQRALDTLGSVAGPLLCYVLLRSLEGNVLKYRYVFMTAGILAAIPLVIIGWVVRERRTAVKKQAPSLKVLKGPFAAFLAVMLLFTLGNSSDAFLLLRAEGLGVPPALIPILFAAMNLVSALVSVPAGRISDRVGRRRVIGWSWIVYTLTYLGFALSTRAWSMWFLFAFYGLFYAFSEGASKALVAELVPDENRGAAYGLYNASIGILALPASLIAGVLWHRVSPSAPFAFGALMSGLALIGLSFVPRIGSPEAAPRA